MEHLACLVRVRQHREELGDTVVKKAKATWITDAGQAYLRSLMVETPIVVSEAADRQEIERLRSQIDGLKDKLIDRLEEMEALRKEVAALSDAKLQLEAHDARREAALQEAEKAAQERYSEAMEAIKDLDDEKKKVADLEAALARAEKERDDARAQNYALKRRGLFARMFRKGE